MPRLRLGNRAFRRLTGFLGIQTPQFLDHIQTDETFPTLSVGDLLRREQIFRFFFTFEQTDPAGGANSTPTFALYNGALWSTIERATPFGSSFRETLTITEYQEIVRDTDVDFVVRHMAFHSEDIATADLTRAMVWQVEPTTGRLPITNQFTQIVHQMALPGSDQSPYYRRRMPFSQQRGDSLGIQAQMNHTTVGAATWRFLLQADAYPSGLVKYALGV